MPVTTLLLTSQLLIKILDLKLALPNKYENTCRLNLSPSPDLQRNNKFPRPLFAFAFLPPFKIKIWASIGTERNNKVKECFLKFLKNVLGGKSSFCANFDEKIKPRHALYPFIYIRVMYSLKLWHRSVEEKMIRTEEGGQ